jgi:putative transposase
MRSSTTRQLALPLPAWGGARAGAGRKRVRSRAALPHRTREEFRAYQPLHVAVRMAEHVWNLRSRRSFAVIDGALRAVRPRRDFRVIHFSTLGNHLHLIAEASGPGALASGMRALSIRLARRLNAMMGRRGRVLEDRYHVHVLRTVREVRHAVRYVLGNYANHAATWREKVPATWADPYSSAAPQRLDGAQRVLWPERATSEARTWLLTRSGCNPPGDLASSPHAIDEEARDRADGSVESERGIRR